MSPAHVSAPLSSKLAPKAKASLSPAPGRGPWRRPHPGHGPALVPRGAAGCVQMFLRVLHPCVSGPGHENAGRVLGRRCHTALCLTEGVDTRELSSPQASATS